jgi:signal transduction histidine kinase
VTETKTTLPVASQSYSRRQIGPRAELVAGFGALLALMAVMSFDSLRTLRAIETNDAQIRRDFLYRERTLEQVRSGLYESGNIVRDYILGGSDRKAQAMLRQEFQLIRDATNTTLNSCIESLPQDARKPFQHLATELQNYWSTLDPIFQSDAKEAQKRSDAFLRSDVQSQHATVLVIAKEVSAVNQSGLEEGERRIAAVFARFRSRLQAVIVSAFGLGLILATTTIVYTSRLEKRVQEKYQESLHARGELKKLSRRLVDAQEQERRAISRELHDEVGQSLSALLMDVERLSAIPGKDGEYRQAVEHIKTLAENSVNEVRNMSLLLRPSMLDDLGLVAALEWQAREVSKRTGMLVDFVEENVSDSLPEEHKTCVYRIVQEALNNCSKHAYAKHVRVTIRQKPEHLSLTIQDDGKGFDPVRSRGLGLVGMTERVSQLNGILKVESFAGRGTSLRVDLPVVSSSESRDRVAS